MQAPALTSDALFDRVTAAAEFIRSRISQTPRVTLVLGSGLGILADEITSAVKIPYADIPNFARSTVEGHAGQLVVGELASVPVVAMQGRFHYYEGYSLEEVTLPIRTLLMLGAGTLLLTNAAGGINNDFCAGCLMLINDHLNLIGDSPLRGANDDRFGPRFPDMSQVYDQPLQSLIAQEAHGLGIELRRGVYAALAGPSYETPAEIRMLRALGADAVGMSTVPEALVARHMGARVAGISCITNMGSGIFEQPINHTEVMDIGHRVRDSFAALLRCIVPKL